jgi:glutamine synthetase type III
METFGGAEMTKRFKEALVTGEKTSESDERILEKALFEWCASKGCINYAHW